MMKWLRAHTKQIMVVVVMLAMFSFVGAQGLQAILAPNPANEPAMKAFGRDVTAGELMEADQSTNVLNRVYASWKPQGASPEFNLRHWFMLAEEAERAGVEVSDVAVESWIKSVDEALAAVGGIDSLRQSSNIGLPQIRHALRRNMAINENASRVSEASYPSEPQVRKYVRDTKEQISVKLAVFDAKNFVDESTDVPEQELQAQFDAYRDVLAGEGDNGFGYRFPKRATIQYVVVDPTALIRQMKISQDDIKDYWKSNKQDFTKIVQVPMPVDPAATQPAEPKMMDQPQQMLFSEAMPQIERKLQDEKSKRIARQAMNKIFDAMSKPWAESVRDSDGYLKIPNDAVRDPAFMEHIVKQVESDFGISLKYGELKLASAEQLAVTPDLKDASLQGANEMAPPVDITKIAFHVPAFFKPERPDSNEIRLQYFQTPPAPLRVQRQSYTFENNKLTPVIEQKFVLFRVTEARDSEAPASLADVRDAVLRDVRETHAYEKMAEVCREFGAAAQQLGSETALTLFDELRKDRNIKTISNPGPFARMQRRPLTIEDLEADDYSIVQPAEVVGVGRSEKFIDACFEMANPDWRQPAIEAPMSSPRLSAARSMPPATPAPKVRVVDLPRERKRIVVEYVKLTPVDRNEYETKLRTQAYTDLASARAVSRLWFDTKNIEKRCDYVDLRPSTEDPKTGVAPGDRDSDDNA
ncbi:MAG: hypothetical protein H6819_03735 [Phycisphaerales bacterium]|nr:hypothetical protein [Phycisphaerales bacterium]MCB9856309.1 hypothetical protein [Phycisphaerales bacterium]MCB9863252.1 hypothetical protein [Phycisphaerales bacterium]